MKKMLAALCVGCTFCLSACSITGKAEITEEVAEEATVEEVVEKVAKTEEELLTIMEAAIGDIVKQYLYVDMDLDGAGELVGVYYNEEDTSNWNYALWYCSSDGEICECVSENDRMMEFEISTIEREDETQVLINAYNLAGDNKKFSVFALENEEVVCLVSDSYGNVVSQTEDELLLSVEAYDAVYDARSGYDIGDSYKITYLFYDEGTYKEYGATQISEEQFMAYENAESIKQQIESEMMVENEYYPSSASVYYLSYVYYTRKNGIVHIQCDRHMADGNIQHCHYTVRSDGKVLNELNGYRAGNMKPYFSQLEVVY